MKIKWDKDFKGLKESKDFKAGVEYEFGKERADEIKQTIKDEFGVDINYEVVEEVDETKEEVEEVKEEPKKTTRRSAKKTDGEEK